MEKKVILVGEPNRTAAVRFMDNIMAKLRYEYKVNVVSINYGAPLFRTDHTEVRFIFDSIRQSEYIQGIRADAIFGIQYPCMMGRVTSDTFMAEKTHMGLDEYIYKIEKEAKMAERNPISELNKGLIEGILKMHILKYRIPAAMWRDGKKRLVIQHLYRDDTAIHVIWDEVTDINQCLNAVKNELDKWVTGFGGYVYTEPKIPEKSMYEKDISEMYPKTMIMAGRQNGKSLYRYVLNAVYGKTPVYQDQLAIYAALMKGENNMPTHTIRNPECVEYCRKDVENTTTFAKALQEFWRRQARKDIFAIKKVYFNDPVTVVIWEDGTKTVVRCNKDDLLNDQYDPEKGLAMAIAKKALGTNKSGSNYYDTFKKWLPKTEETEEE